MFDTPLAKSLNRFPHLLSGSCGLEIYCEKVTEVELTTLLHPNWDCFNPPSCAVLSSNNLIDNTEL